MNRDLYSNKEFTEIREIINKEMLRRGTFKWWDPLSSPKVGQDRSSPLSIPDDGNPVQVDDKTYTINNPSEGSIEETRNIIYPAHGSNPSGQEPDKNSSLPNTSAAAMNVDEMRNFLVGLAKINDINLYYGREEIKYLAYRSTEGIKKAVADAEKDKLNALLSESDISATKNDPNGGIKDRQNINYPMNYPVTYPMENGRYVMPSGEHDGEELLKYDGLNEQNFYDDYGAQPGDANFHPTNRFTTPVTNRDWHDHDNERNVTTTQVRIGGLESRRFGTNPRNPNDGDPYPSRPVYGGKQGTCVGACTGLCYMTCDNECSESCTTTCWNRCGEACTSTCGNSCTSCSSLCHTGCKTKCENSTGYSCVKSGAKAVKITTTGGKNGVPAKNNVIVQTHTCMGCSYSCQFYPNKKTECWDAGCMSKCFTSCTTSCSTSCFGGCIDNTANSSENDGYKTGKGRGCSSGCTLNCIGLCDGVCEGYCINACYQACKQECSDNCDYECSTNCGNGCEQGCTNGCMGCSHECSSECENRATNRNCVGCGAVGGCTSTCQQECNKNCMGKGCRNICGTDSAESCEANCRLNCTATSCTAMCSDACSSHCSTCVNTCGFQCGMCSSLCSTGCEQECNINCSEECSQNCSDTCIHSCTEDCGGCSNLCYSCIGMCIGVCSVKCENGCSSCANNCGWWCDSSCNRECFGSCSTYCINSCVGSCSTLLQSDTKLTKGPERPPTADGYIYPDPKNRWEERESFKLFRDVLPYSRPKTIDHKLIQISIQKTSDILILEMDKEDITANAERVYEVKNDGSIITNISTINPSDIINVWRYYKGEFETTKTNRIYVGNYVYTWDINRLGSFKDNTLDYLKRDRNFIVIGPDELEWTIQQTTTDGGVFTVDPATGEVTVNEDMLPGEIDNTIPDISSGTGIFVITLHNTFEFTEDDIEIKLPFDFELVKLIHDKDGNTVILIRRTEWKFPEEGNNE